MAILGKALYSDLRIDELEKGPLIEDVDAVHQSAQVILATPKGTRFFNPEFGADLDDKLFELGDNRFVIEIEDEVIAALPEFDPRIKTIPAKTVVQLRTEQNACDVQAVFTIEGLDGRTFEFVGTFDGSFPALTVPACRPFLGSPPQTPIEVPPSEETQNVVFIPVPPTGFAPHSTTFRISITGSRMSSWKLTFGDGKAAVRSSTSLEDGDSVSVPHTYELGGNYRATLDWVDSRGDRHKEVTTVTVTDLACDCTVPLTVLTQDDEVITRHFLLSQIEVERTTIQCPLAIDGRWDGETYIHLVGETDYIAANFEGVELVDFYREGILVSAYAVVGETCSGPDRTVGFSCTTENQVGGKLPTEAGDGTDGGPWAQNLEITINPFNQSWTANVGDTVDIDFSGFDIDGDGDIDHFLHFLYGDYPTSAQLAPLFNIPGLSYNPETMRVTGTILAEAETGDFVFTADYRESSKPMSGVEGQNNGILYIRDNRTSATTSGRQENKIFVIKYRIGRPTAAPTPGVVEGTWSPTETKILSRGQQVSLILETRTSGGLDQGYVMGEKYGVRFINYNLPLRVRTQSQNSPIRAYVYDRSVGALPLGLNYDPNTNKIVGVVHDEAVSGSFTVHIQPGDASDAATQNNPPLIFNFIIRDRSGNPL